MAKDSKKYNSPGDVSGPTPLKVKQEKMASKKGKGPYAEPTKPKGGKKGMSTKKGQPVASKMPMKAC